MILKNGALTALIAQQGTGNAAFMLVKLISYSFIFLAILTAAYLATRYIGKKSAAVVGGRNIQIIEKVVLGLDKSLYIISVGDHFYLLAASKQNLELLTEIRKEEIKQAPKTAQSNAIFPSFDMYLKKFTKNKIEDFQDPEWLQDEEQEPLQRILTEFKMRNHNTNMSSNKDEHE